MAYATLDDLKAVLGITASTDDALLARYLMQAQATIDRHCRRTFEASADATRTFDAVADVEGRRLWLDDDLYQITSITNGDGVAVSASSYVTAPRRVAPYYALDLKANSTISWTYTDTPEGAISIVGRWAYSLTAPADIEGATLMLASFYYNRRGTEGYAAVEVSNAVNSELDLSPIPAHIAKNLVPYVRLI